MNTVTGMLCPSVITQIHFDHLHVLALHQQYRSDSAPLAKQGLVDSVCRALEVHEQLEDEIFYPALEAVNGPVMDQHAASHDEMLRSIDALREMDAYDADYDAAFRALMHAVIHHAADEETIVLPDAERLLAGELDALGARMARRRLELVAAIASQVARDHVRGLCGDPGCCWERRRAPRDSELCYTRSLPAYPRCALLDYLVPRISG
ncbi:MAG: hemerythrin protein [Betaproteobacteria bacterium]|nr:hemerythrin protein [Betaproteobacteria bacterium]